MIMMALITGTFQWTFSLTFDTRVVFISHVTNFAFAHAFASVCIHVGCQRNRQTDNEQSSALICRTQSNRYQPIAQLKINPYDFIQIFILCVIYVCDHDDTHVFIVITMFNVTRCAMYVCHTLIKFTCLLISWT